MVEEVPASGSSVTTVPEESKVDGTLNGSADDQSQNSIEASAQGGAEAACNNSSAAEGSAVTSDGDLEKSLEFADDLMEKGYKAMKESDFYEAAESFSRALEIRFSF